MKTRIKHLGLMSFSAAVVLSGLGSCSNDNAGNGNTGETKSVYLKFSNSGLAARSTETPVVSGSTVDFSSGDLYFVNAAGAIEVHKTITTTPGSTADISLTDLSGLGVTVYDLPGSVEAVYVVGHTTPLHTSGNISAVKDTLLDVESQVSLSAVNLYGTNTFSQTTTGSNQYFCTINLNPTIARLELTNIQAASGSVITGFKVDGIFIDNYYSKATVEGVTDAGHFISNGALAASFSDNTSAYPVALKPAIYNWYTTPLAAVGVPLTVSTPTAGDVWAFNVFATKAGVAIPHIIVRLSGITTNDGSIYADPQFLTITGLNDGTSSLPSIESGKVYHIGSGGFTFDETNLTENPNLSPIDVEVKVILATWTVVPVSAEF